MIRLRLTFISLLLSCLSFAQVPGAVIDPAFPATNPLDPNGDGFITSTGLAFQGPLDASEFELPFLPLGQYENEPALDNDQGEPCVFFELVGDPEVNASSGYYFYTDPDAIPGNGDELVFFRVRLAGFANSSSAFSILIDTDYRFGFVGPEADPNAREGNPGFEREIAVLTNTGTSGGIRVYNTDDRATGVVEIFQAPLLSHYQVSYALNPQGACATPPSFADVFVPFAVLGVTATTQVRIAVAANNNVGSSLGKKARDIGGVDGTATPNDDDQFIKVITNFAPIALNDPSNLAPFATDGSVSLTENTVEGTLVYTVAGTDANSDALTYTIARGNTADAFSINNTTGAITIKTASAIDIEAHPSFTLVVAVSDGKLYDNAIVTVMLTDVNEFAPTASNAVVTIEENLSVGSLVHIVQAGDRDRHAVLTYSFANGNEEDVFEINASTGAITVKDDKALDFENTPAFAFTVHVTDGIFSDDAIITVNVADVNEPPLISDQTVTLDRLVSGGEIIYTVLAIDPDANNVLSFSIDEGNDDALFLIDAATGKLKVVLPRLLYLAGPVFALTVSVTDQGGLTASAVVTIVVSRMPQRADINPQKGFSPDGNGTNDFWRIEGIELFPDNNIYVFNRWGVPVYDTQGYDNESSVWRGEVNGSFPESEMTYFFVIKAGNFEPITGYVLVKP